MGSGGNRAYHLIYNIDGCNLKKISYYYRPDTSSKNDAYFYGSTDGVDYDFSEKITRPSNYENQYVEFDISTYKLIKLFCETTGKSWFRNITFN